MQGDYVDCGRCVMYLENINHGNSQKTFLTIVFCGEVRNDGTYVKFKDFEESQNFINNLRKDKIIWKQTLSLISIIIVWCNSKIM